MPIDPYDAISKPVEPAGADPYDAISSVAGAPPEAKPEESGIVGWVKGKVAENEARRREALKNPLKSLVSGVGNTSLPVPMPGTVVRQLREATGNTTPFAVEQFLPDPTVAGVAKGVTNLPIKAGQIVGHTYDAATGGNGQGLASDRVANWVDNAYRMNFQPSQTGELAGEMLLPGMVANRLGGAAASAPKALRAIDKVRMILSGGLKGGASGAVLGATARPVVDATSNADFFGKTADSGVQGGKYGAIFGAVAPALEIGVDAWANKYRTPAAGKLLADAEAANIPLKASEIATATKPAAPRVVAAEKAVTDLSTSLKRTMEETPFAGLDEVRKAAAGVGKRADAANAILEEIAKDPKASENILQTSGGLAALREKMRMDQLAEARDTLAQGVKGPLKDAAAAVQRRIDQLSLDLHNNPTANKGEIAALQALQKRFLGTPAPDHLVGEAVLPTFQQASATRANLNDIISGLYKGNNAVTGQADAATLQAIKVGLRNDMSRMAQESGRPALAAADRTFQSEYSKFAGTFKDPAIVKAITSDDPSVVLAGLSKAGPEKAQRVFDALDAKGKAAYAAGVFKEAIKDATNPRTGDWIPGNVAMGLHKTEKALGVTIKDPAIRAQMDSTLNVLQALAKSNPEQASALGQRVTGSIVQASDKTAWAGKLYQAVKDNGMDIFFNSKAGKDFLFKAKGLSPDSPAMAALIRQEAPAILAAPNITTFQPSAALKAASTGTTDQIAEKKR